MIVPAWLRVAEAELRRDVVEVPGDEHSPQILAYHAATSLRASTDEVPWCAAFVCFCLQLAGRETTNSARARDYLGYGVELVYPAHGCIAVLQRGSGAQPGVDVIDAPGHVGFIVGEASPDEILLLGGNQGDRVCVRPYPVARLLSCRWPT
jgi:uncharacterized protein (TIGR02594 family)